MLFGKKVLLTGAHGMLAGDLLWELRDCQAEIVATDILPGERFGVEISTLDITDEEDVFKTISVTQPDWIINCAAYTQVDRAENEEERAKVLNEKGVLFLACAAAKHNGKLLHLSTDYVFGGKTGNDQRRIPYGELDSPSPCGVYGESKYLGERALREALPERSLLVRTSWLHGLYGPNFIHSILHLAKEKKELKVVSDQIGSPTWSSWLAKVLIKLLQRDARGIYHVSSRGGISWFEYAKEIVAGANLSTTILPQTTVELARPAPRPAYSTLDVSKVEEELGEPCISWKDGVKAHLQALGEYRRGSNE